MFEREIKFIYDFNLNKVNKLGPYFTFEQLQNIDLHPAILNYISAEIDYLVFEDRQKLLKNSVFDYSGEKIVYYFTEITEELKKTKRFSLEYIAKLILHAASFTVNYLVRPKWTLTRFIFDEAKYKSTNEIKQILNYVYYYKFVKKIIVTYINTKKILSMNAEEFEELLNRTDKLGIENNLKGIISSSLISMAEFFNIGQMQKTRIPLSAVELFLEEKDLPHHLQKISNTLGADENAHFYIGDYMKVITSVMAIRKEEEPLQQDLLLFEKQADTPATEQNIDEDNYIEEYQNTSNEITALNDAAIEQNEVNELPSSLQDLERSELIASGEEEITIKPNSKIRIIVSEGNKIEHVTEEDAIETAKAAKDEEALDTYSTVIKGFENEEDLTPKTNDVDSEIENTLQEIVDDKVMKKEEPKEQELFFGKNYNESGYKNIDDDYLEIKTPETDNANSEDSQETDELIQQRFEEQTKLELSELLEHKNITKIIEVVFDYDIEDFASMLDEVSSCKNVEDAHFIINETLATRRINRNTKEADTLRDIISEYFNRR
ncbi:MAG: hypothetical protein AB1394_04390 [Bacteroidota bacterium]